MYVLLDKVWVEGIVLSHAGHRGYLLPAPLGLGAADRGQRVSVGDVARRPPVLVVRGQGVLGLLPE